MDYKHKLMKQFNNRTACKKKSIKNNIPKESSILYIVLHFQAKY